MSSFGTEMLKELLIKLFSRLEENEIDYCVIGNYYELPEYTSNDVDIWVSDSAAAENLLLNIAREINLKLYMQNKTANGSNNYFYSKVDTGINIVKIDLMAETAFKSIIPIVDSQVIKNNRILYNGFYVANDVVEGVMHLLYPLITFGIIKDKYKDKLYKLIELNEFRELLVSICGKKLFILLDGLLKNKDWKSIEDLSFSIKRYMILKMLVSLNASRLQIFFRFLKSIIQRAKIKNGIVIGFTGIDGAGKSSVKNYLIKNSDRYFTKSRNKEFYWRPFLFPRVAHVVGSKGQKEIMNVSGKRVVSSSFLSGIKNMMKYLYYVSDFIFGQAKYFKQSHTGGLVVFDRYHFDNIVYPERFGFKLNKVFMRFFDKYIIPQPDILFYFTADSDVLYDRKHEIDVNEINEQKSMYSDEMNIRKDVITISTNGSFDDSVKAVLLECFQLMSSRYK